MKNPIFSNTRFLYALLIVQIIPLVLFPPSVFQLTSQKWWLPVILVLMTLIGSIQIIRKSNARWPIYLVAFSHGFNIISRLLMLFPQTTETSTFDGLYLVFSVIGMLWSVFMLWLLELPQVRQVLVK